MSHTITHTELILEDIKRLTEKIKNDKVIIGSAGGLSMVGGEKAPTTDDDGRDGWLFQSAVLNEKFNYYFYGAGNTLTTIGDLKSISCLLTIDTYVAVNSLPFFVVYSKATGSNDYSWYKSSILYTLSAGEKIHLGEEIQAWSGVKPKKQSNKRMVEFNVSSINTLGSDVSVEELYTITIHSDSGGAIGTKILVNQVGFDLYSGSNKIERRIDLR